MDQLLAVGEDARPSARRTGRDEALDAALDVEQFQGARPQNERLGLVGARRRAVDDAHRHAALLQWDEASVMPTGPAPAINTSPLMSNTSFTSSRLIISNLNSNSN